MNGFEIRRVHTPEDWRTVRTLRFDGLAARAEIAPDPERAFADAFDAAPDTVAYLLLNQAMPAGTTRSSVRSRGGSLTLPSQRVFARELAAAFGDGATIVEASLTFVEPRTAGDPQEALLRLFKMHMLRCAAVRADALVVAVRDSQLGFYRRLFGMEILSGEEPYPGMRTPRVLMGLAFPEQAPSLLRRIPALAATAEEEAQFAQL